jgi:tetratricopeptide (TPR) repeat protein
LPIDREATLRNAEKFLRVGRLDAAIAEYARVVEDQPRDWTTANSLGDLYLRAGQPDKAVALYQGIVDHLLTEGFYPKAGALLKKILKIRPDDEVALVRLGEIAAGQGLTAEAKGYYSAVARRRNDRGDAAGADEMVARLGLLDPSDLDARANAARALERRGEMIAAAAQYRGLYDELLDKGREDDAAAALIDFVRCNPNDVEAGILLPVIAAELKSGRLEQARGRFPDLLSRHPDPGLALEQLAESLVDSHPDAAAACLEAAVDSATAAGDHAGAAAILQRYATAVPGHIPTLLRLIEVAVDGDLDASVHAAQAQLADAYLAAGRAQEARVIAEDLVTRDRSDDAHIERLRRALQMLDVPDVETVIAERLTGAALDPLELLAEDMPAPTGDRAGPAEAEGLSAEVMSLAQDSFSSTPALAGLPPPAEDVPPTPPAPSSVPEIDLTVALLELRRAAAPEPPPPAPPPASGPPRELEAVFAGLRADASASGAEDDSEEYIGLARTYSEMGLRDEAIEAWLTAVKSPRHRFLCASMLAQLYRDAGDIPRAIEWYERAAEAPPVTPEDGRKLMYDLGDILETIEENARALAIFIEIQADAPGFMDVPTRIRRLSGGQAGG